MILFAVYSTFFPHSHRMYKYCYNVYNCCGELNLFELISAQFYEWHFNFVDKIFQIYQQFMSDKKHAHRTVTCLWILLIFCTNFLDKNPLFSIVKNQIKCNYDYGILLFYWIQLAIETEFKFARDTKRRETENDK